MRHLAVGLALLVAVLGEALAQQPIIIKFSHVVARDTPKGKAADYFKKLAEERTRGRVRVEVYPNSQLYKDKEELDALKLGAVQMLAPSVSKFGPMGAREFEVFDLPYLFSGYEALHKVTDGAVGKGLLKHLETRDLVGLAYWDNGFKVMTANRALHRPEDVKGLKLRIQSSKVLDAQMRALGGIPQVMAFSEVYQALQTGVVDGTENTLSNVYTQKTHEVQKFLTVSEHGYIGYAVVANKKFWDSLPADLRTILEGAMHDATRYANEIAQKENDDALEAIRRAGRTQIITLTPAERAAWRKALLPVHRQVEDKIGHDLIQSIYKATGVDPTRP